MRASHLLIAAAVTGLLAGATGITYAEDKAPVDTPAADKNACKGKDGCKADMKDADKKDADCKDCKSGEKAEKGDKDKNACKGKDGCKAEEKK